MLNFLEYLKSTEERRLLKTLLTLSGTVSLSVCLWALEAIKNRVLPHVPIEISWQLFLLAILTVIWLLSYVRYVQKEMKPERILRDYEHDARFGAYRHKQSQIYICKSCLFRLKVEIPLQEIGNGYQCTMNECGAKYFLADEPDMTPPAFG